jgi:hypothetical protein
MLRLQSILEILIGDVVPIVILDHG